MLERLKQLNKQTGVTMYLCDPQNKKMVTIHEGKVFDGEIPQWMLDFADGSKPLLPFDQEGQRKHYFNLKLNGGQSLVFLDEPSFTLLSKLMNKMLEPAAGGEAGMPHDQTAQVKAALEAEKKLRVQEHDNLEQMKDAVASLKTQNADQAVRLKDALAQNLTLSHEIKQLKAEDIKSDGLKLRGTVTLLRDENTRLLQQVKQWEEKCKRLQDRCDELMKNRPASSGQEAAPSQQNVPKGLFNVVNALNKVIATGDASTLNLETLSMIVPVPARAELERNPDTVKSVIAKLLGMERSGQLSAFQIKKLNDGFGG